MDLTLAIKDETEILAMLIVGMNPADNIGYERNNDYLEN